MRSVGQSEGFDGFGRRYLAAGGDYFTGFSSLWGGYYDSATSGDGGQTGLTLLMHRFYDPAAGRFLTRDPMGYDGGINLYAYTQNDPVNRNDLEGYMWRLPKPVTTLIRSCEIGISILTGHSPGSLPPNRFRPPTTINGPYRPAPPPRPRSGAGAGGGGDGGDGGGFDSNAPNSGGEFNEDNGGRSGYEAGSGGSDGGPTGGGSDEGPIGVVGEEPL